MKTCDIIEASEKNIDPSIKEFLDNINEIAVDTGITDLADQHDHYLYGLPKHKNNKT